MIVEPVGGDMATSAPGEQPLYVVCTSKDGYGFSLTRFTDERSIELMVEDQTNLPTRHLVAYLHRDKLVVKVVKKDVAKAEAIGIPTEYTIPLSTSKEQLSRLDTTLEAIFDGVGTYHRKY